MAKFAMYGKLTVQPGKRDEFLRLMLEEADTLESMDGCELYILNESEDDPDVVWVTELWRDQQAHDASLRDERVMALIGRCRPLIRGGEQIRLRPVGGKGLA